MCEIVLRKILHEISCRHEIDVCYKQNGWDLVRRSLPQFNAAAKIKPCIVLVDLDPWNCIKELRRDWMRFDKSPRMAFRVAAREVESWIMADNEAISGFLKISKTKIPKDVDALLDPKLTLVQLASTSPNKRLKDAIVPSSGSTAVTGKDYNAVIGQFVLGKWEISKAMMNSPSLKRSVGKLREFCESFV